MPESQISVEIILNTTTNVIQNMFAFACIILHSLTVSLSHHKVSTKGLHYSTSYFLQFRTYMHQNVNKIQVTALLGLKTDAV